MVLQNTFYIVGIICMTLYTLLLIVVIILLFYIKKRISELTENIHERIDEVKTLASHPKEVAASIGAAVADAALTKTSKIMKSKRKK